MIDSTIPDAEAPVDAGGTPLSEDTTTPVKAGDVPDPGARQCTSCEAWFPRLEIVNARCASCTTAMDNAGSSVIDVKGPHALQKLAVHAGSLAQRVAALEAAVFGENDGPQQA